MKKFAFFDLDYTLLPHDTMLLFCRSVLQKERFRIFYLFLAIPAMLLYLLHILDTRQFKSIFFSFLFRMKANVLEKHSYDFVRYILKPLLYDEMLKILSDYRRKKYFLVLNTASPSFYVSHIANELGFDAFYATNIEVKKRMPLIPVIEGANNKGAAKIEAMQDILPPSIWKDCLQKGSFSHPLPIQDSVTYSDSFSDNPLFLLAERKVVIKSAKKKTIREASKRGWESLHPKQSPNSQVRIFWNTILQIIGFG